MDSYRIKLEIFEGPLDLLLHLIKKNELDIYDIPIALITKQYMGYLDLMKNLNLDIAGEFLVMASTLTLIKSRMLLPTTETGDEEDEGEDPRAELIQNLLEYQKFKDLASELYEKELAQREIFTREGVDRELFSTDEIWIDATIFDLLNALKELLESAPGDVTDEIFVDEITVSEKINHILEKLEENEFVQFESLFSGFTTKIEIIVTFLALLELIKMRMIRVQQTSHFGAIRIYKSA
jgi:segregation and condensation protein A